MRLDEYTIERRYGKALFELAIGSNKAEETYQDLVSLRQIYEQVPGLDSMLSDVRLEPHERREIMDKLVSGYDGVVKGFLEVVYAYNRMGDLSFMVEEHERRYGKHQGLLLGSIATAVPLSNEQQIRLEKSVAKTMNYQSVGLKQVVDPSIIGGAIVETNHRVINGSIRTQLENMRNQLNR